MDWNLVPCAGCKEPKVLKLGDYCIKCALEPEVRYFVVKPDTLDHIAKVTGMAREYLNAKQERAFENYQVYVIYGNDDDWQEIVISERFHLAGAMQKILAKEKERRSGDRPPGGYP